MRENKNNKCHVRNDIALASLFKRYELRAEEVSKIYLKYWKPIFKYLFQRTKDQEVANDLGQEVFLKVYRFRASYRPHSAFSSWLWAIARNTVSDWRRKNSISQNTFLLGEEELPSEEPNAEVLLERKFENQRFIRSLSKLTHLQRKVLWMRVVHSFSYREISKKLGLSLSAVKCLVYRSKKILIETT